MRAQRSTEFDWSYSLSELWADGAVHVLGLVLTLVGAVALIASLPESASPAERLATGAYLVTLAISFGASAAYNIWPVSRTKWRLRRLDHSAIYLLIAGTYTPFLTETGATRMLGAVWAVAAFGVVLKLCRPGRYDGLAILLYLALGWSGLASYDRLTAELSGPVLGLIVAGGLVYSSGVVFHLWKKLRFHNVIWHGFVLTAASLHYAAVWLSLRG